MTITTTKATIIYGNWTTVPMLLTRVGNGWHEEPAPPADPRTAWAPKPAVVKKQEAA